MYIFNTINVNINRNIGALLCKTCDIIICKICADVYKQMICITV